MPPSNAPLIQRWFEEVWNKKRLDAMDEMADPNIVAHGHAPHAIGLAEFKPFVRNLMAAFPDIHFTLDPPISQDDMVAARWRADMTHSGEFMGIPPTDRKITIYGISMARMKNGRWIEAWDSWDQLGFLAQIGALTPPALF